ncbi:MAG: AMP-binding protein [Alphaproteobacteria bacterium]|nr:AMP-binding protein [Alphaproteobacteria bacterium]
MIPFSDPRREQDLATVLAKRVARSPDKPWIVTGDDRYSYGDVDIRSGRMAQGFADAGVEAGDTVALMLPDTVDYIWAWCALSKLGAIEVPVNVHYRGSILSYVINDSSAKIMVVHADYLERIEAVAGDLNTLEQLYVVGAGPSAKSDRFELRDYHELFASPDTWQGTGPRYRDLMAVMYTSGTTGPSKGATITHAHAYEYAYGVVEMLELKEDDVYYAPLPLFHLAGQFALVYCACIAGATAVLPGAFSAHAFWTDVRRHRATTSFLLGAMANFLYGQEPLADDADNPLERVLMVPLIPETEAFKSRFDCLVSTTWGGTEMNCPMRSGFDLVDNKSCGRLAEDRYDVRIVDEDDREVPPGVPGEALVRTKEPWIISNGYWNHPEWTVSAWRNQWFHTGDMLMRDEAGNYYFVDRSKDAIRRRGENISSMEVENEINSHPDVLESAVIPVESSHTEQEVMAVVVAKPGHTLDPEHLIRFLEPRMAYFMVPRYVEAVAELPKTPTRKIQKFPLREAGVSAETWDREAAGVKLAR